MNGVARDHESLARAKHMFAPVERKDSVPLDDHDGFFAVVPVDRRGRAGVDGLHPNLQGFAALQWAGDRAVGKSGEFMFFYLVIFNNHGTVLSGCI